MRVLVCARLHHTFRSEASDKTSVVRLRLCLAAAPPPGRRASLPYVWASKRLQAENDPDSCWNGESVIVCSVGETDKLFGDAGLGLETEVFELCMRTDAFEVATGDWAEIAKRSSACLASTAGMIFRDSRILRTASVAGYVFLDSQARGNITIALVWSRTQGSQNNQCESIRSDCNRT